MPNFDAEQAALVEQVAALIQRLDEALDRGDSEQILAAQQNLTAIAEMVWTRLDQDAGLTGREKAVVRLLTGAALKELPVAIQDPANYPRTQRELRILKSSLVLLK